MNGVEIDGMEPNLKRTLERDMVIRAPLMVLSSTSCLPHVLTQAHLYFINLLERNNN